MKNENRNPNDDEHLRAVMTDQRADSWLLASIIFLVVAILLMLLALVIPAGATCTSLMMMQGCVHEPEQIVPAVAPPFRAEACLTKAEARTVYPGKWLYWHGRARCWDATPVGASKPVQRTLVMKRAVALPPVQDEPVQNLPDASTFPLWDSRIGIPFTKPEELTK